MVLSTLERTWDVKRILDNFRRRITALETRLSGFPGRDAFRDSDFVELTIDDGNFEAFTPGVSEPKVRRIGKWVELNGALRCTTTDYMVGSNRTIFTIPLGFRPSEGGYNIVERRQASGTATWGLQVNTGTGTTTASRYNGASHGVNLWLPFNTTWITDDSWPT